MASARPKSGAIPATGYLLLGGCWVCHRASRGEQASEQEPESVDAAVCEIEGDLRAIDEFADALALVSKTMDESPHANAINRLAWEIKHRAQKLETRRDDLLRLARPNSAV